MKIPRGGLVSFGSYTFRAHSTKLMQRAIGLDVTYGRPQGRLYPLPRGGSNIYTLQDPVWKWMALIACRHGDAVSYVETQTGLLHTLLESEGGQKATLVAKMVAGGTVSATALLVNIEETDANPVYERLTLSFYIDGGFS